MDTLKRSRVLSCRWILPLWEVPYCILSTKGMFVLFHGLRKWENCAELGPLCNCPPALGGCPWWPPPPPLPKAAVWKHITWHLGTFPFPTEMLIWQMASLLPHLPWFKCPESPGRASCAGKQVRETIGGSTSMPTWELAEEHVDQLLNTPTNKAEGWKCHFAASWQQSPRWQGATQHQTGAESKPLFLHTYPTYFR